MPITNVRSPQRNVAGPIRRRCRGRAVGVGRWSVRRTVRRSGSVVVVGPDRAGPDRRRGGRARPRRDRANPPRRPGRTVSARRAAATAAIGSSLDDDPCAGATPVARQSRGQVGGRHGARRRPRLVQMTVAPASAAERRPARAMTPVDVLVGHRRRHERERTGRRGTGAGRRARRRAPRRRPGCGHRRAARRGRRHGAARGGRARRPSRSRVRRALVGHGRDAGRLERVERRVGDGRVGRLVAARAARPASARGPAGRPRCRRGPSRGAAPARPRSAARPAAARAGGRPPARHRARRSRPGRRAR